MKRLAFFRPICRFISKTVKDTAIVTMEDEHELVFNLSNRLVSFSMTVSDYNLHFKVTILLVVRQLENGARYSCSYNGRPI